MNARPAAPAAPSHPEAVRALVHAECLRPSNRFGAAFLDQHLLPVVEHGLRLARRLGADPEVVELAGWLHDLAAVRDLSLVPTHHLEGARIARDLLRERGVPEGVVEGVCRCIASHSSPVAPGQGTPEEVCLSNADVISQLARPAYWFFYLHGVRGLGREDGLAWWQARVDRAFGALVPEAQEMAGSDRATVLRLLAAAR
jgi:uncharacterized protein